MSFVLAAMKVRRLKTEKKISKELSSRCLAAKPLTRAWRPLKDKMMKDDVKEFLKEARRILLRCLGGKFERVGFVTCT